MSVLKAKKSVAATRGHAWSCIHIRVYTRCTKFNSNLVARCTQNLFDPGISLAVAARRQEILRVTRAI